MEKILGNIKVIEKVGYRNSIIPIKYYICKKLTKNGVWREFRRFNASCMEEAIGYLKKY